MALLCLSSILSEGGVDAAVLADFAGVEILLAGVLGREDAIGMRKCLADVNRMVVRHEARVC